MVRSIVFTGLFVGTLDAIAAIINFTIQGGKDPVKIFNFIASGFFGKTAFEGGLLMAMYGLVFHYIIAIGWTAIFFLIYPRIIPSFMSRIVPGIIYGIIVWTLMNLVVLPISNTPPLSLTIVNAIIGILIIVGCVGLPIAYFASSYYSRNNKPD
jgi:hypothetical protein